MQLEICSLRYQISTDCINQKLPGHIDGLGANRGRPQSTSARLAQSGAPMTAYPQSRPGISITVMRFFCTFSKLTKLDCVDCDWYCFTAKYSSRLRIVIDGPILTEYYQPTSSNISLSSTLTLPQVGFFESFVY